MTMNRTVLTFLTRHRVAHMATADATGRPHVIPICFALAGNTLYSVIDRKPKRRTPQQLRRVRNLLANPRAAIVADVYWENWKHLGYVLIEGKARLIARGREHAEALRALRAKYSQYRTMRLEDRPVIAVAIERAIQWGKLIAGPRRRRELHVGR